MLLIGRIFAESAPKAMGNDRSFFTNVCCQAQAILAKGLGRVLIASMSAVARDLIADDQVPNMLIQGHEITKRQIQQWFDWMDRILSLHRSQFVFRQATSAQLQDHKIALKEAIRYCLAINTIIADPDFNESDLVTRLQVRIRQLQDAYDTFHDTTLSNEQAEEVLRRVFPE
jgi:hypothetical protein